MSSLSRARRDPRILGIAASSLVLLAVSATPRIAAAAPAIGVDLEGAIPLNAPTRDPDALQGGSGFKVRFGQVFHVPFLRITPEIGYGFDRLFGNGGDHYDSYGWDMHRVFAGARLGFGAIVVPTVYAHVGYGWRTTDDPSVPEGNGLAFDAGAALDLHLIRHFGFGAHAEYATIATGGGTTPQWLALGLHIDVEF
jgi:hypothetical protein